MRSAWTALGNFLHLTMVTKLHGGCQADWIASASIRLHKPILFNIMLNNELSLDRN